MTPLIEVEHLTLQFKTDEGLITAVDDVSFTLMKGEVMGLVGESGSGKSVTAKSLMHLNARNAVYSPESKITLHTDTGPVDVLSLRTPRELNVQFLPSTSSANSFHTVSSSRRNARWYRR